MKRLIVALLVVVAVDVVAQPGIGPGPGIQPSGGASVSASTVTNIAAYQAQIATNGLSGGTTNVVNNGVDVRLTTPLGTNSIVLATNYTIITSPNSAAQLTQAGTSNVFVGMIYGDGSGLTGVEGSGAPLDGTNVWTGPTNTFAGIVGIGTNQPKGNLEVVGNTNRPLLSLSAEMPEAANDYVTVMEIGRTNTASQWLWRLRRGSTSDTSESLDLFSRNLGLGDTDMVMRIKTNGNVWIQNGVLDAAQGIYVDAPHGIAVDYINGQTSGGVDPYFDITFTNRTLNNGWRSLYTFRVIDPDADEKLELQQNGSTGSISLMDVEDTVTASLVFNTNAVLSVYSDLKPAIFKAPGGVIISSNEPTVMVELEEGQGYTWNSNAVPHWVSLLGGTYSTNRMIP